MKLDIYISLITYLSIYFIFEYIAHEYETENKYKLYDHFTEMNDKGLFTFAFVETQNFDEKELKKFSNRIFKEHESFKNDSVVTKILVAYFFNRKDSNKVPPAYLTRLKLKYPKVNNLSQKINYYPNGYVYTTYKSKAKVKNIAKDSLFKTPVFAPKKEFKSINLLKN